MALCLIGAGSILVIVGGLICLQSVYNKGYTDGYVACLKGRGRLI